MFAEVTRVYKVAATGEIKTQKFTVAVDAIESVRPSNRLGYPEHRSTITLISGATVDLSDTYSSVRSLLDA